MLSRRVPLIKQLLSGVICPHSMSYCVAVTIRKAHFSKVGKVETTNSFGQKDEFTSALDKLDVAGYLSNEDKLVFAKRKRKKKKESISSDEVDLSEEKIKKRKVGEQELAPTAHEGQENDTVESRKARKSETTRRHKPSDFIAHVATEPQEVQDILAAYSKQLKRRKSPEALYIINDSMADVLVRSLDPAHHHLPHIELAPGPGVLTRRLLRAGVASVNCFEPAPAFRGAVQGLVDQTAGAVRLTPLNFLNLAMMAAAAAHGDDRRLNQCLHGLSRRDWHCEPCVRVVGVVHRRGLLRHLVRSVITREHLFQYGRPELVVFVPDLEFKRMTAVPGYRGLQAHNILTQLLFDLEPLRHVPAKHFYPWMVKGKRVAFIDSEMVLVRFVPKVSVGLPTSELPNLDCFVRHCATSKNRRIIPQFEEWVPGCGPRLIALGHGVFSPFRELTPAQLLALFVEFCSWPEYPACSFHTAIQQDALGEDSHCLLAEVDEELAEDDSTGGDHHVQPD